MEVLSYVKLEDMLEEREAKDHGRYFICNCPSCEKPEAYVYKNNTQFITCNRAEECGSKHRIVYENVKSAEDVKLDSLKKQHPKLTDEQVDSINWLKKAFNHFPENEESDLLNEGYRGLSPETTKHFVIDFQDENLVNAMFHKIEPLFDKDYRNNSFMTERNLISPIYDDDGNLERMLLRSSINEKTKLKEISLIIDPSKDTRDFFIDVPDEAETIVVTEALFDSLSFREIHDDVGFIALTGSLKTRQVESYFKENEEFFKDKNILFALDNDNAGNNALQNLVRAVENNDIGNDWNVFDYGDNWTVFNPDEKKEITDPNDFLQESREHFNEQYVDSISFFKEKNLNKDIDMSL